MRSLPSSTMNNGCSSEQCVEIQSDLICMVKQSTDKISHPVHLSSTSELCGKIFHVWTRLVSYKVPHSKELLLLQPFLIIAPTGLTMSEWSILFRHFTVIQWSLELIDWLILIYHSCNNLLLLKTKSFSYLFSVKTLSCCQKNYNVICRQEVDRWFLLVIMMVGFILILYLIHVNEVKISWC